MSQERSRAFDVVVIGAGASGGWAARLSEAGLSLALVHAGRPHTDADAREHTPPFPLRYRDLSRELRRHTRPRQQECHACTIMALAVRSCDDVLDQLRRGYL